MYLNLQNVSRLVKFNTVPLAVEAVFESWDSQQAT